MTDTAVQTSPLSEMERMELVDLEMNIKKGLETFVVVGASLDRIRDRKLYREEFATYEDYCESRWSFKASRARQLIGAYKTVEALTSEIKPQNEAQTRILNRVSTESRNEVWEEVVRNADGPPTTAEIKEAVDRWQASNAPTPEPEVGTKEPEPEVAPATAPKADTGEIVVDAEHEVMEPEDEEDDEPDPFEEIVRLEGEVERLRSLLDDLDVPDQEQKARLTQASERIAGLEGALALANKQKGEAVKEARYAKGQLKKVRAALGVERDRDILTAIEALKS